MTPLNKIKWLRNSRPELSKKTAYFIGIKDYIFHRLSGELINDYGTASGTGYFDIHEFRGAEEVLDYLDIRTEQLPQVLPSTYQVTGLPSEIVAKLGLPNDVSFVLGGADGPLPNLGLGAFGDTIVALTVGTSGALRFITTQPQFHPETETFCYILDQKRWVVGGAIGDGTGIFDGVGYISLQEVVQSAREKNEDPYDALLSAIAFVPTGASGLIFHPYSLDGRVSLWDTDTFGSFIGLQGQYIEKEMMKAILEGICLSLYWILEEVCQGNQFTEIRVTGGLAQSPIFHQMMTDALGYLLVFLTVTEASALGAVALGGGSIRRIQSVSEAQGLVELKEQVGVQENDHKKYQKVYPLFVPTQRHLTQTYQQFAQLGEELADSEKGLALWIKRRNENCSQINDFVILFVKSLLLF